MNLRDILIKAFLSQSFTYNNFVNLLKNHSLYDANQITEEEAIKISGLSRDKISHFFNYSLVQEVETAKKNKIKFLTILDDNYPPRLMESYQPPIVLTYQGNLDLLKTCCLGIVGGRVCPKNSFDIINKFCDDLVNQEVTVVSGLAKGIDAIALNATINHGGNTIAIIGTGLNQYYPRENQRLQEKISDEHLIISEYPPNEGAKKYHFPARNRIIAGISHGVLIASARNHSGSLITGNLALQNNREVFAFPGECDNSLYEGSNKLIQAGAKLVLNAKDVILDLQYYW